MENNDQAQDGAAQPVAPVANTVPADPMVAGLEEETPAASVAQESTPDEPAVVQESTEESDTIRYVPRGQSEHVRQDFPVFLPLNDPWDDNAVTFVAPSETGERVEQLIEHLTSSQQKDMASDAKWVGTMVASAEAIPKLDFHSDQSKREGSMYAQVVVNKGGRALGITKPKIGDDDGVLTGSAAVMRVRTLMGLGTAFRVPLWHSGFWITLRSPTDAALLELDRRLTEEKISLGRSTIGLLYSNESVFMVNHVMNFVLEHIESTTLKDSTPANVLKNIDVHDIQTLAWGLACGIYPSGFQYARAVLGETPDKNHVIEGLINVSKLQWTDTGSLTEAQVAHMSQIASGSMTNESVQAYKEGFATRVGRQVDLKNGIVVNLKVPTLDEHLNNGQQWVNSIVLMTDRVFGMEQNEGTRNAYITAQGKAVILRQYGHWIESIQPGKGLITDQNSINEVLVSLSSDDAIRDQLMNEITQFAEDSTFSFIAVPTENAAEENRYPRMPHLLPLDALSTFFILLRQRLQLILTRG